MTGGPGLRGLRYPGLRAESAKGNLGRVHRSTHRLVWNQLPGDDLRRKRASRGRRCRKRHRRHVHTTKRAAQSRHPRVDRRCLRLFGIRLDGHADHIRSTHRDLQWQSMHDRYLEPIKHSCPSSLPCGSIHPEGYYLTYAPYVGPLSHLAVELQYSKVLSHLVRS